MPEYDRFECPECDCWFVTRGDLEAHLEFGYHRWKGLSRFEEVRRNRVLRE